MQIKIQRGEEQVAFEHALEDATLLEVLDFLKTNSDTSLSFSSGCRSCVCGSCAVRVNDKEVLACSYKVEDGDIVEPLKNSEVLRDLVVNLDKSYAFNAKAEAWLIQTPNADVDISPEDASKNELQSDCILCSACYSACPVYSVNGEFLGPLALTRVWRYVSDKREGGVSEKIAHIQTNGVWDCTLCNECTVACPQQISSKADIEKLRAKSAQEGFIDPSFGSFGGFGGGFDGSPVF